MAKKAVFKMPKTLGGCADLLYTTQQKRYALQREAEALDKLEGLIEKHIIDTMPKSDGGAQGKVARVERKEKQVPRVTAEDPEIGTKDGWPQLRRYIVKNDRWDLLYKRLNDKAIRDLWDDKKTVPGVVPFTVVGLSIHKV